MRGIEATKAPYSASFIRATRWLSRSLAFLIVNTWQSSPHRTHLMQKTDGEMSASKYMDGIHEIKPAVFKGFGVFVRVAGNFHIYYRSYNNKRSQLEIKRVAR
jgi:hypothetical protein